ncbi:hypothetical protein MOQ72_37240 [Saccharopolyspora sp. K220]|uniref:hypothetical protein n=1 Tax=Saccharopolyspora soli TaxID=2926618 RepID=UPI001F58093E|nr:hypothetical protein [Saccharopolyspora soli]MCI2423078.1 hypothetical protein [Saccharopolyspora soli]
MSTSHTTEPQRLFGRDVTCIHRRSGERTAATVTCIRRGRGPDHAMQAPPPGTLYTLTLQVHGHAELDTTVNAATPWDALTTTREHLEQHEWFLAIAAARRDCWPIQLPRRHEATTVAELSDRRVPQHWQGFLADADPNDIGTLAEQQHRYQIWLSRYDTTSGS